MTIGSDALWRISNETVPGLLHRLASVNTYDVPMTIDSLVSLGERATWALAALSPQILP